MYCCGWYSRRVRYVNGRGFYVVATVTFLPPAQKNNSDVFTRDFFQRFFGKSGKSLAGVLSYTIFWHELDPSQDRVRPFFSMSYVNNFYFGQTSQIFYTKV